MPISSAISKPIIGLTADYSNSEKYSKYPWYALRQNYCDAVAAVNGLPIILPYDMSQVSEYCKLIDGLIITGGDFDIDPCYYNEKIQSKTISLNKTRTSFEIYLFNQFFGLNKPILGICGGMQLINVALNGSLVQDIEENLEIVSKYHQQQMPKHIPAHSLFVDSNTMLFKIAGIAKVAVNSSHHQCIKKLGDGIIVSGVAEDGIIEAIEHKEHDFCIGTQWHPEYMCSQLDRKIFESFVAKAIEKKAAI